jgi:hypothetical protein
MTNDRAVEALAQLLYDASDPLGIIFPWSHRLASVRTPWLALARERLTKLRSQPKLGPVPDDHDRETGQIVGKLAVLGTYQKHGMGARPLSLGTLTQETSLEPGMLVSALFDLIDGGLIDEMDTFSSFADQPTFRLLAAGRAALPDNRAMPQ